MLNPEEKTIKIAVSDEDGNIQTIEAKVLSIEHGVDVIGFS